MNFECYETLETGAYDVEIVLLWGMRYGTL